MPSPTTLAQWEGFLLLGGFFGIVFWKLANGSIGLEQLLEGDIRDPKSADGYSSQVSAGRAQTLLITVFVALYYLIQVIQDPTQFPQLPDGLVAALAGSQALYLGGKAQAMLFGRLRDILK
jgi:Na+/proline symporter